MKMDKVGQCVMEIYRRMYKEASPSADILEIIRTGESLQPNWFMKYRLEEKRQDEIFEEVCRQFKLKAHEKQFVHREVYLGCAPRSKK